MKKYACNRLYMADGHYETPSVVRVDKEGKVEGHFPLTEEASATEWIGGVVVLSDKDACDVVRTDFRTFLHTMTRSGHPLYAWHISGFDFLKEDFTPQSVIRRL